MWEPEPEPEPWASEFLMRRDVSRPYHCPTYKLPANGIIELSPGNTIALDTDAVFRPQCQSDTDQQGGADGSTGALTSITDIRDPFHASITPQAYATGAATVVAWMLVIMLIITPRTFFLGNASGRSGLMGRRGIIGGATGSGSVIGVGSRPWLQKAAALTVAISLTLATADTFKIAQRQYDDGFIDAKQLRTQVVAGMEIKVSRVISDIFLWLAQVQTLIRLFPRHKEKVIIKWVGFALILLDIVFSSLNSFGPYDSTRRPAHFDTAIPALSYLFQLSLSMLYAAWVMYYAITKRRFAFYHAMMWNMSVVALLSTIAILTPVIFFITDIANYTIAGWGDYFRWVGAAAASVIVWEWVERIEALEREERKDGILGREIYDGDDMLDSTPSSSNASWPSKRRSQLSEKEGKNGAQGKGGFGAFAGLHASRFNDLAHALGRKMTESPRTEARKRRSIHIPVPAPVFRRADGAARGDRSSRTYQRVQTPPSVPVISSPVSRTDTTSADSTVYNVRYHPVSETPPHQPTVPGDDEVASEDQGAPRRQPANAEDPEQGDVASPGPVSNRSKWQWQGAVGTAFRRKGRTPPQELQRGRVIEPLQVEDVAVHIPRRNYNGLALSDRLGTFAAQSGERFRSKRKAESQLEASLPVTIIPAQPRGQTWSPDILHQQQDESLVERENASSGADSGPGSQRQEDASDGEVLGAEVVRRQSPGGSGLPPIGETTTARIDFSTSRSNHDR